MNAVNKKDFLDKVLIDKNHKNVIYSLTIVAAHLFSYMKKPSRDLIYLEWIKAGAVEHLILVCVFFFFLIFCRFFVKQGLRSSFHLPYLFDDLI
jgi:hypothetical protein